MCPAFSPLTTGDPLHASNPTHPPRPSHRLDGLPIKEIVLRRPTVGDHLAAQTSGGTDAEREIRLIANLAELPPEAIHQLDMADYMAVQQVLSGFLSRQASATTSKRSSSNSRSTPTGQEPNSSASRSES